MRMWPEIPTGKTLYDGDGGGDCFKGWLDTFVEGQA